MESEFEAILSNRIYELKVHLLKTEADDRIDASIKKERIADLESLLKINFEIIQNIQHSYTRTKH